MSGNGWELYGSGFIFFLITILSVITAAVAGFSYRSTRVGHVDTMAGDEGDE